MSELSLQALCSQLAQAKAANLKSRLALRQATVRPGRCAWADAITAKLEAESSFASLGAARAAGLLDSSPARRAAASGACE